MATNFPDFVYQADGTIWTTNTDANIRKSTDYGTTFTQVAPIGAGDPNVTLVVANGHLQKIRYMAIQLVNIWLQLAVGDYLIQ